MAPCGIDTEIKPEVIMTITKADGLSFDVDDSGICNVILTSNFPETIWRCKLMGTTIPNQLLLLVVGNQISSVVHRHCLGRYLILKNGKILC